MKVLFDEKIAPLDDALVNTPEGRKAYELEGELIPRLVRIAFCQKILEVECGTRGGCGLGKRACPAHFLAD